MKRAEISNKLRQMLLERKAELEIQLKPYINLQKEYQSILSDLDLIERSEKMHDDGDDDINPMHFFGHGRGDK